MLWCNYKVCELIVTVSHVRDLAHGLLTSIYLESGIVWVLGNQSLLLWVFNVFVEFKILKAC